jgi:ubiquinone/menaquinone biosynthesis C-methylase UbiE
VSERPAAGPDGTRRHYGYTHYANREVAEGFDALRFGGPIGRHLLEVQQAILLGAIAPIEGRHVLDVGTGTGRAALALAAAGARVTGVDASREMLGVARARAVELGVTPTFEVADAQALPFANRSMDAAICFRLLMHVQDWRRCVKELCRVSRWRVVLDFPARSSFAALESMVRRVAATAGRATEPYIVLAERDVRMELASNGFRVTAVHRQFVLPIALHKTIGSVGVTTTVENGLRVLGLRRLLGSPVTMVAER